MITKTLKLKKLPWKSPHRQITDEQWKRIVEVEVYAEREPAAIDTPCRARWVWRVTPECIKRVMKILRRKSSRENYFVCSHQVVVR